MYKRKTKDEWQLITDYGYGEEVETSFDDKKEADECLITYRTEKMGGYLPSLRSVRLRKKRVKI